MRILHLCLRYWPACGGAEVHLGEFSTRLAAEGHQVTVATSDALDFELFWDPRRRRIDKLQEQHNGVHILRFPVRHLLAFPLAYAAWRRLLWILSAVRPVPISVLFRLARFSPWVPDLWHWLEHNDESFDLVAAMGVIFEPVVEMGLRFARRQDLPFVIYPLTHLGAGPQPAQDPPSRFYTMRHQIDLVRQSDAVVAQTPTERTFYQARGVPADRISVVGPGVNPKEVVGGNGERFRRNHNVQAPLVVFLSAMSYDKGAITTVEAVRRLWQAGHNVELVLAGTLLTPFRSYLDSLPPADQERLRVLGRVSDEEKRDMMAACDMLVMPSRVDSFGIVYLEAWLYRKPVIGARAWGINDVITHDQDGLLIPFGDETALAEAITHLLDHPDQAKAMGIHGETKVYEQHTWETKFTQVHKLYQDLTKSIE
ncbi:MAG: glycosyltransferase family 4 protein [Chloroflexi bacterium]|nr:glycosyltransferase family 4 protein [Chloroflexota bacterium]